MRGELGRRWRRGARCVQKDARTECATEGASFTPTIERVVRSEGAAQLCASTPVAVSTLVALVTAESIGTERGDLCLHSDVSKHYIVAKRDPCPLFCEIGSSHLSENTIAVCSQVPFVGVNMKTSLAKLERATNTNKEPAGSLLSGAAFVIVFEEKRIFEPATIGELARRVSGASRALPVLMASGTVPPLK